MISNLDSVFQIICMITAIVDAILVLYYDTKKDQYRVLKYLILTLLMTEALRRF